MFLYREQFPTGNKKCPLEEAVKLCSDKDRVDSCRCASLTDVGSALACFKAAQDEIIKCKQVTEMGLSCEEKNFADLVTSLYSD